VLDSGRADLAAGGLGTIGNCFSGNVHRTSLPWGLETLNGCRGFRLPLASDLSGDLTFFGSIAQIRLGQFTLSDYKTRPKPRPQPNIPGGADAKVTPAVHVFAGVKPDLDAIKVPHDAVVKPLATL
jgi:hypothetical protein